MTNSILDYLFCEETKNDKLPPDRSSFIREWAIFLKKENQEINADVQKFNFSSFLSAVKSGKRRNLNSLWKSPLVKTIASYSNDEKFAMEQVEKFIEEINKLASDQLKKKNDSDSLMLQMIHDQLEGAKVCIVTSHPLETENVYTPLMHKLISARIRDMIFTFVNKRQLFLERILDQVPPGREIFSEKKSYQFFLPPKVGTEDKAKMLFQKFSKLFMEEIDKIKEEREYPELLTWINNEFTARKNPYSGVYLNKKKITESFANHLIINICKKGILLVHTTSILEFGNPYAVINPDSQQSSIRYTFLRREDDKLVIDVMNDTDRNNWRRYNWAKIVPEELGKSFLHIDPEEFLKIEYKEEFIGAYGC